jgi:hypothetical protein
MKIRLLFLLLTLLIFSLAIQAQEKWNKTEITEAIQVELPPQFTPVSEQDRAEKYISYRTPLALYTTPDRKADFSVNLSVTPWADKDLPLMKDFYKASLSTLYSEIDWLREEIVEINKQPIAIFEYRGTVAQEEGENVVRQLAPMQTYNYIAYVLKGGKVAVFTFSAPAGQQQLYQPVADRIMHSIKLKKDL